LNIPEGDLTIHVISPITMPDLKNAIESLCASNVALKQSDVLKLFSIIVDTSIHINIDDCKNRELRLRLYEHFNDFPSDPDEFMKYLCYKITHNTCIVKNQELLQDLKYSNNDLLEQYISKYGYPKLSQCFYRWKDVFLALKNQNNASLINKVSRLSKQYHTKLPINVLNNINSYDTDTVIQALKHATIFKKIQLCNYLRYTMLNNNISCYRIRNRKVYVHNNQVKSNHDILEYLMQDIVNTISKKVKNMHIKYPDYIDYAVPTSNKNMLGNIPCGSKVSLGSHGLIGVHWYNVNNNQTDLDLSLVSATSKIGWNGLWNDNSIRFSGDMTNAPLPYGAAEFFSIRKHANGLYNIYLNNFTARDDVPFSLFIQPDDINDYDYIIKNSESLIKLNFTISTENMNIGYLSCKEDKSLYISNSFMSMSNVSKVSDINSMLLQYYQDSFDSMLRLREVLELSGAIFDDDAELDLSPNSLSSTTLLNLIKE
jgi:hypothetical protein